MNTFILWIQIVLMSGFGEYEHRQTLTHPKTFDSYEECQQAAEERRQFILRDLDAKGGSYLVITDCEPISHFRPDYLMEQSHWM